MYSIYKATGRAVHMTGGHSYGASKGHVTRGQTLGLDLIWLGFSPIQVFFTSINLWLNLHIFHNAINLDLNFIFPTLYWLHYNVRL